MTPALALWYVQTVATLVGTLIAPWLFIALLEWPFHFVCSAFSGLLVCVLTWCTCQELMRGFGISHPSTTLGISMRAWSVSVGCAVSLSVHYALDYWQSVLPAAVR